MAVDEPDDGRVLAAAFKHRSADGRLAGTDVARNQNDALAHADRVLDRGERFAVLFAGVEEPRVRRVLKRQRMELIILVVHGSALVKVVPYPVPLWVLQDLWLSPVVPARAVAWPARREVQTPSRL